MSAEPAVEDMSVSEVVIDAVATREGAEPTELAVPLFEAIDPDALDALFQHDSGDNSPDLLIEFTYYGYDVTVTGDGSVSVSEEG